jgi:hypothetical protein
MIFEVNGKRIVFGMQWKSLLSETDVHRSARAVKSPYLWHGEKAFYYGVLSDDDKKAKLKSPMYSGAIALMSSFPDVANLMIVLEIPDGKGFIVCGIHEGRPRNGSDAIVATPEEADALLKEFARVCGSQGFKLYGNVAAIGGITPATMADIVAAADDVARLRRVKSALVSPLVFAGYASIVLAAGWYGYHTYSKYKAAEAARKAMAQQKNSQQLYMEEYVARRADATVAARAVSSIVAPIRHMTLSVGGWPMNKATCNAAPEKRVVCTFVYARKADSQATYQTFASAAASLGFENVDYAGDTIKALKGFKSETFIEQGKAVDAAKTQHDETIEFGSLLQRAAHLGKTTLENYQPFAVPPTANIGELTTQPFGVAAWEFDGPLRSTRALADFPDYATVSQVEVTLTDKPAFDLKQSMAMVKVTGKAFSKPN